MQAPALSVRADPWYEGAGVQLKGNWRGVRPMAATERRPGGSSSYCDSGVCFGRRYNNGDKRLRATPLSFVPASVLARP